MARLDDLERRIQALEIEGVSEVLVPSSLIIDPATGVVTQPASRPPPPSGLAGILRGPGAGSLPAGAHFWTVTAVTGGVESLQSNEVALSNAPGGSDAVDLTWAAPAGTTPTSFRLYRSDTSGGETTSPALAATGAWATSFRDGNATVSAGAAPVS